MTEPLDRVLQLVAEGKLSADDAAPLLDALQRSSRPAPGAGAGPDARFSGADLGPPPNIGPGIEPGAQPGQPPRWARIEVREHGRRVVDLRVPISLGRFALSRVPGLSSEQVSEVEQAVMSGAHGPILDVQDPDGDGVRIVLE
jgi:hypothetical protein